MLSNLSSNNVMFSCTLFIILGVIIYVINFNSVKKSSKVEMMEDDIENMRMPIGADRIPISHHKDMRQMAQRHQEESEEVIEETEDSEEDLKPYTPATKWQDL